MSLPFHSCTALTVAVGLSLPGLAFAHPEAERFADTVFIVAPELINCALEDGSQAQCHEITVGYLPDGLEIGPFCPATLDEAGGIWEWTGENEGLYRINRDFLMMLDALGYRFFDEDGSVHVVDNVSEQPQVDHACINVSVDESVEITMLLPADPVIADSPTDLGVVAKIGVGLDGAPIFADAPSIQQTGHMPALDTCGGHVDPGGWYHWHATSTDIQTVFETEDVAADCTQPQDASAQFGYAFDGFAIYGSREADGTAPGDLDACNGHVGATPDGESAYHYHASESFPNLPACLVGVQAQGNFMTTATAGIGAQRAGVDGRTEPPRPADGEPGEGPGGMPPGFDEAAATLKNSVDSLMQAMTDAGGREADLAEVASALGLEEDDLRAAFPAASDR